MMYNKKTPIDTSCGFRIAIEVMGGKWKPYIIYELLGGPLRPSELQRRIPDASQRVLAQQLKELVEYGVVEKRVIDPVCLHSEYGLTDLGRTLIPVIEQLRDWGDGFRPRLEEIQREKCRLQYADQPCLQHEPLRGAGKTQHDQQSVTL